MARVIIRQQSFANFPSGITFLRQSDHYISESATDRESGASIREKRFHILTHSYAASFFIKTSFCETNNIFYS